jgi:hypothetical protein
VHQGESTDSIVDALSRQHVIGSSLAFQVSEVFHGTPSVLPGSYAMHQNLAFSEVRTLLAAGPNIYPVDVRPGFTFSEVAQQVDNLPGHAAGGFAKAEESGVVHSTITATDPNNLEGMLGTGTYLVLPDETDTTILTDMVQRFDHDSAAAGLTSASAAALGLTPYQLRSVRARPGRGTGDVAGPQGPVPVQHLPHDRSDTDTHLHAFHGCAPGCRPPTAGRLVVLRAGEQERHDGLLGHLRRAAGQRATGEEPWSPLSRVRW